MKIFRMIRIFLFGPSKAELAAEISPPTPLLSAEQRDKLRRDVTRGQWLEND